MGSSASHGETGRSAGLTLAIVSTLGLLVSCSSGGGSSGVTAPALGEGTATTSVSIESDSIGSDSAVRDLDEGAISSIDEGAGPGEVRSVIRTIPVDQTVRYAGFDVQVHEVSIGFDPAGFAVAVVVITLTNDTPHDDRLQTAIEVASHGQTSPIDRDSLPEVPAGGSAPGTVSIRLDPATFTFDDAVLYVGRLDRQRAQIPLGSAGELVTLAPAALDIGAEAADETSSITIDHVMLTWDTADPRGQAAPGQAFLAVAYTLESSVDTAFTNDSVVLVLPDGSLATGEGGTIGRVDADVAFSNTVAFPVAEPPAGEYVLRYTERFDRGIVDVPFTVG